MLGKTFRAALFILALSAVLLGVSACLPVPLGDPEKAKADPKYIGAWEWKEDQVNKVAVIRGWDERTYVVDVMSWTGAADAPKPRERAVYKGWLAEVKGSTFLNLQAIESLSVLPGQKREVVFLICKLSLNGDSLVATPLDGEYAKFKDIGTSTALEKVVTENFDDVKMWSAAINTTRVPAGRAEELQNVLKSFANMGE